METEKLMVKKRKSASSRFKERKTNKKHFLVAVRLIKNERERKLDIEKSHSRQ